MSNDEGSRRRALSGLRIRYGRGWTGGLSRGGLQRVYRAVFVGHYEAVELRLSSSSQWAARFPYFPCASIAAASWKWSPALEGWPIATKAMPACQWRRAMPGTNLASAIRNASIIADSASGCRPNRASAKDFVANRKAMMAFLTRTSTLRTKGCIGRSTRSNAVAVHSLAAVPFGQRVQVRPRPTFIRTASSRVSLACA